MNSTSTQTLSVPSVGWFRVPNNLPPLEAQTISNELLRLNTFDDCLSDHLDALNEGEDSAWGLPSRPAKLAIFLETFRDSIPAGVAGRWDQTRAAVGKILDTLHRYQ